jgi:hypothetical protein
MNRRWRESGQLSIALLSKLQLLACHCAEGKQLDLASKHRLSYEPDADVTTYANLCGSENSNDEIDLRPQTADGGQRPRRNCSVAPTHAKFRNTTRILAAGRFAPAEFNIGGAPWSGLQYARIQQLFTGETT